MQGGSLLDPLRLFCFANKVIYMSIQLLTPTLVDHVGNFLH